MSVLLPARNAASTVRAAVRSVLSQSFRDFQCVVVDDGSTDQTRNIVAELAARDSRILLVPGSGDGIVSALMLGLAHCSGDFIARMDADDLSHVGRFEQQVRALDADPALAGVGCHVRLFPTALLTTGMRRYEKWLCSIQDAADLRRDAYVECPVAHPSLMFRSNALRRFGYETKGWPEDYDLVLRMLSAGERLSVVPKAMLYWRESANRLSRTSAYCAHERIVACKAHYLARGLLRHRPRYVLWGYGDTGKELAAALREHGKLPSLVVEMHPGRIGQRICGAPVVHPDHLGQCRVAEPILASVSGSGPRQQIRAALAQWGYREGRDFVSAA